MFMGMFLRSSPKPECISALTARAIPRAAGSDGHSCSVGEELGERLADGKRVPHRLVVDPQHRHLAVGDHCPTTPTTSPSSVNLSCTSSNGMPACFSSTQGRMDQDE